jgi:hypothetical protein
MADDFDELFYRLRAEGFAAGADQYLRMRQLGIAGLGMPAEILKTHLAPIFASSAAQQRQFYAIFDSLFGPDPPADISPPAGPRLPPRFTAAEIWAMVSASAALVALLIFAIVDMRSGPGPEESPQTLQQMPAGYRRVEQWVERREPAVPALAMVSVAAIALAGAGLIAAAVQWVRRHRMLRLRQPDDHPPYTWSIPPLRSLQPFDESAILHLARAMKRREAADRDRLDVRASIMATIRAGGDPQLVHRRESRMPEYLAVIERLDDRDHQAEYFDRLVAALAAEGVAVRRFFHHGDPRICWSSPRRERITLRELHQHFHQARLLLFGNPASLLDPFTGELADAVAGSLQWGRQIAVTFGNVPARAIAALSPLLQIVSGSQPLERLADLLGAASAPYATVAGRSRGTRPLSAEARRWLYACAAYPQLHWDLTLALGPAAAGRRMTTAIGELLSLPAFRTGMMKQVDRLALVEELATHPELEQRARDKIIDVLDAADLPPHSCAGRERRLQVLGQQVWLRRDDRRRLEEVFTDLRRYRVAEIGADPALVRLLVSAPATRVLRRLPRRFRRVWLRSGIPALGFRDLTGAAIGLVAAVAILGAAPWQAVRTPSGPSRLVREVLYEPEAVTDTSRGKWEKSADRREPAAIILELQGMVVFQRSGVDRWNRADERISLFGGDWIRTDDQSSAELLLDDGSVFTIGPNALMEVRATRTAAKESARPALVVGSVEIADSSPVETRTPGTVVQVGRGRLSPPPVLFTPDDDALITGETVELKWSATSEATEYLLQVSRSRLFTALEINSRRRKTEATARLTADGAFYWRVAAVGADGEIGEFSSSRRFRAARAR